MAEVKYSDEAIADLDKIGDYIENNLQNPIAAYNTIEKIQDSIDNLAVFPLMGTPLSSIVGVDTDYRYLVCGKYLAFYHVDGDNVLIDHVIFSRRDYIAILFPNLQQDG